MVGGGFPVENDGKGEGGAEWLFAQKPCDPPNRPKTPQTPNFPENPALPQEFPTEFILSAIQSPTEFH